MKRRIAAVLVCVLAAPSAGAHNDVGAEADKIADLSSVAHLDLRAIVHEKALELAAVQVPQVPQTPTTAPPASSSDGNKWEKLLYFATLAAGVVGTMFNIRMTRSALDHRLRVRTFPLVWTTTNDPADKGQVSAIIAGANFGILGAGAWVYKNGNAPLATFVNVLVAGATSVISLHDRVIITDCEEKGTCR